MKKGEKIQIVPCKDCGVTPPKMYGINYCRDCFRKRLKGEGGKSVARKREKKSNRLWVLMNEVWNEAKDVVDKDPAKNRLRKLRDDNPSRFVDQMSKIEPKSTDSGVQVVIVHLPVKLPVGSDCPPPAADTKEAVERLVMELEDRKGL